MECGADAAACGYINDCTSCLCTFSQRERTHANDVSAKKGHLSAEDIWSYRHGSEGHLELCTYHSSLVRLLFRQVSPNDCLPTHSKDSLVDYGQNFRHDFEKVLGL